MTGPTTRTPSSDRIVESGTDSSMRTVKAMKPNSRKTAVSRIVLLAVIFLVAATIASGLGAALATSGEAVASPDDPTVTAAMSTGGTVHQANDTTETRTNATTNETESDGNASGDDVPSGAMLAGVIGAHEAEHQAAVESRAFDTAFENAETNASKAAVVAGGADRIEERVLELEVEMEQLIAQKDAGNIGEGEYYAKMAVLETRLRSLEHLANQTTVRGHSIPASALATAGLQEERLRSLENRTTNASTPQGRSIAGQVVGSPAGMPAGTPGEPRGGASAGPPSKNGPPASGPNASEDRPSGPNETGQGTGPANAATGASVSASNGSPEPGESQPETAGANKGNDPQSNTPNTKENDPRYNSPNGESGGESDSVNRDSGSAKNQPPAQGTRKSSPDSSSGNGPPEHANSLTLEILLGFLQ